MKYTKGLLGKLENISVELGYKIRYEQGHFQSGFCRVETRKLIIINKFFDIEGRINTFLDLLPTLPIDISQLGEETLSNYNRFLELRASEEMAA
ncbi:MAG: hypothetical protein IT267_07630 [Saprospiraceae bacterium]|nr:hypothetical protein [Saprospiraceae bacterium]